MGLFQTKDEDYLTFKNEYCAICNGFYKFYCSETELPTSKFLDPGSALNILRLIEPDIYNELQRYSIHTLESPKTRSALKNESKIYQTSLNDSILANESDNNLLNIIRNVQSIISGICLTLSLMALTAQIMVYILIRTLHNFQGHLLTAHSITLMVALMSFIAAPSFAGIPVVCYLFAIIQQFAFLCDFFLLQVLCFDLGRTMLQVGNSGSNTISASKRKIKTILILTFVLGMTLIFVGLGVAFDLIISDSKTFLGTLRPNFGPSSCWFKSKTSLIVLFLAPIFVIVLINAIIIIRTLWSIHKRAKETRLVGSIPIRDLALIYLRLLAIGGITWLIALIYQLFPVIAIEILFIICNSLQGLFVALSFFLTRSVMRRLQKRILSEPETSSSKDIRRTNRALDAKTIIRTSGSEIRLDSLKTENDAFYSDKLKIEHK